MLSEKTVKGYASNILSKLHLAERSLRPVVVMRKISGGTRTKRGSDTRMALASLFGTWQARGLNPFDQRYGLLSQKT